MNLEITDNTVIITREDGSEDAWKLLFYYHNEERGKDYYFLYKEEDPDALIVMASRDGQSLENVSEEEFAEAEEMLDSYENDPTIQTLR